MTQAGGNNSGGGGGGASTAPTNATNSSNANNKAGATSKLSPNHGPQTANTPPAPHTNGQIGGMPPTNHGVAAAAAMAAMAHRKSPFDAPTDSMSLFSDSGFPANRTPKPVQNPAGGCCQVEAVYDLTWLPRS